MLRCGEVEALGSVGGGGIRCEFAGLNLWLLLHLPLRMAWPRPRGAVLWHRWLGLEGTMDLNCAAQMLNPVVLTLDHKGFEQRFWVHSYVMHLRMIRLNDT